MSDEPNAPSPMADPNADPTPVPLGQLSPGRIGFGVDHVALVALVFVATLLLLLGVTRLVDRGSVAPGPSSTEALAPGSSASGGPVASGTPMPSESVAPGSSGDPGTGGSGPPGGTAPPSASPPPTGDPVLVGAGDIGQCGSNSDEDTAALLDGIGGTVFTTGDNAYENGTAEQYRDGPVRGGS